MKKHLLKSLLVGAMTLAASGVWAQTVTTYDFEDGNALFTQDSRITASVVEGTQTIYDQAFELDGKAVSFKGANNAQNGYCFAHFDFSSLCDQAAKVKVEFDAVLGNGARSIISVGDASVRGNTGNSTKTTYSNKGAIFRVGTDKSYSYVNGSNVGSSTVVSQKWLKVTIEVDEVAKNYTYSIVNKATEEVLFSNGEEPVAFYSSDATNCTQIDMFGYINNSQMGLIDNLIITVTKDERQQANYTVNFLDTSNNPIKDAVTRSGAVGDPITLLPADKEPLWNAEDTQKYIYQSDDTEGKSIEAAGTTVVNVVYRDAEVYNYTLLSSLGTTLTTGSGFEGESPRVAYPRYQLDGTDLYMAAVDNKEYRTTVNLNEDNVSKTINYTLQEGKVAAFYTEAEDIEGITVATNDNIPVRASNAKAATTTEDVTITTLAPGKYILHVGIFTSKSSYSGFAVNFGVGEEVFAAEFGAVNLNEKASEEYVLNVPTTISYLASSSADTQFDYIWIEKTGDVEVVPVATKTIGLVPGVWAADDATFAAYAWNAEGNAWFPFVEVSGAYVTQIPENYTGINIVRLKPATAEGFNTDNYGLNWDNKWNQTGNIDFTTVADNTLITITGWDTYEITIPVDIETAKAKLTEIIAQAKELNKYANDEALAAAITKAEAAVAGDDATAIASAAVDLETTATAAAKDVLGNAITLAGTFGIDASAAQAVLNDEDASAEDLANALKNFVDTAIPAAKDALAQAKSFFNTFDKTAAEALKDDFDDAEAALAGTDINAMITAAQTLMYDAMPAAQKALEKVFKYVELIDDATLNADAAAIQAAMADSNLKGMIDAANKMKEDFPTAVQDYLAKVEEIANTEAYGEKGVDALKSAIDKAKSAIVTATFNKDIVAMGEAIRNLVLAVEAYKEANITYTVVGGFDNEGDIDNIIFGKQWNPSLTDNDMEKQADGTWTKVYENITLNANTTIFYKVVKNHSWDENWGFEGNNADYIVNEAGKYNIYFLFNPTSLLDNGYNVSCNVVDATTDGISSVVAEAVKAGQAYNLSGQRVVKAKKGLYIIDGKKMVIR